MNEYARVGIGYDIHRLAEGRRLVLGGVEIPYEKGLLGHSDSDVLIHAVCDALLGAAAIGDIGTHFPDSDPQWSGASSLEFASKVVELLAQEGWGVTNVDSTIMAERPKIGPYREKIRQSLASVLRLSVDRVSVKAKTNEGLDSLGRNEAIAAHAVVLIHRLDMEADDDRT